MQTKRCEIHASLAVYTTQNTMAYRLKFDADQDFSGQRRRIRSPQLVNPSRFFSRSTLAQFGTFGHAIAEYRRGVCAEVCAGKQT